MAHCQRWITISLLAGSEGTLSATWWLMCEAVVLESAASGASLQPNQVWLQQSSLLVHRTEYILTSGMRLRQRLTHLADVGPDPVQVNATQMPTRPAS